MTRGRARFAWVAVYVAAAVFAYWPSLAGAWVYDDHRFIATNEALHLGNAFRFFHDPTTVDPEGNWEGIYRPLRSLSYAVDRTFFDRNPVGYRIHSLLVHILTALAFGVLAGRLFLAARAPSRAARRFAHGVGHACGVLFAVHPIQVESVAWMTSRADVESGLAAMLCLLVLARPTLSRRRFVVGVGIAAAACLAKESAVMVPVVGLVLSIFPLRRARTDGSIAWRRWAVVFVVTVLFVAVRSAVLGGFSLQRDEATQGWPFRIPTMVTGLVWYLGRLAWPSGFRFDYQLPSVDWTQSSAALPAAFTALVSLAVLVAAALVVVALATRWTSARFVLVGSMWFAVALLPMSNLLVSLNILVAERFLYFAAGGAFLAVGGVVAFAAGGRGARVGCAAVACVAIAGAAWTTSDFAAHWRTERALWEAVRAHSPDHYRPHQGLAKAHVAAGNLGAAKRALARALACPNGQHPDVWFDLGRVHLLEQDNGSAVRALERAAVGWQERGVGAKDLRYRRTLLLLIEYFELVGNAEAVARYRAWLRAAGGPPR